MKDVMEMIRLIEQDKKTGPYQLIVPIKMFGGVVVKQKQQRWKFALGTKVRVRGVRKGTARIAMRHQSIAHGAVFLDKPIDGTQWWNEDALARVKPRVSATSKDEPQSCWHCAVRGCDGECPAARKASARQLRKVKRRLKGTKVRPHLVRGHFKLTTRNDGGPRSVYVDKHVRGER